MAAVRCSVRDRHRPHGSAEPTALQGEGTRVARCAWCQLPAGAACPLVSSLAEIETPPADHSGVHCWPRGCGIQISPLVLRWLLTGELESLRHFFSLVGSRPRFGSSLSVLITSDSKGTFPPNTHLTAQAGAA